MNPKSFCTSRSIPLRPRRAATLAAWGALLGILLACNLFTPPPSAIPTPDLAQTQTASAAIPPSATPLPSPTPQPTATPIPTDTPQPTATPIPSPTPFPPSPTVDIETRIKSAKIVVYEDAIAFGLPRYVKAALDGMGLSYTDTVDRIGDFKSELTSGQSWDLIIVASEARGGVRGEFFDYIGTHLDAGSAVIIELWYLDKIYEGRIKPLLAECGIAYQKNWKNVSERAQFWLVPDSPLFHEPNEDVYLTRYLNYWLGDVGDLIQLTSGSQATLLAGVVPSDQTANGTLASCYDGRMLFQTFSSHDYHKENIVPLWQNYIYYVLKNRFLR